MSSVNHWVDTGEELSDWRYADGEGSLCVTLVHELSENPYSWVSTICCASGYAVEHGEVYVEYKGAGITPRRYISLRNRNGDRKLMPNRISRTVSSASARTWTSQYRQAATYPPSLPVRFPEPVL